MCVENPITKKSLTAKTDEMIKQYTDALKDEVARLVGSGAVDLESWPDTYALPKIVLTAAIHNTKDAYAPLFSDEKIQGEIENLKKF